MRRAGKICDLPSKGKRRRTAADKSKSSEQSGACLCDRALRVSVRGRLSCFGRTQPMPVRISAQASHQAKSASSRDLAGRHLSPAIAGNIWQHDRINTRSSNNGNLPKTGSSRRCPSPSPSSRRHNHRSRNLGTRRSLATRRRNPCSPPLHNLRIRRSVRSQPPP